MDPAVSLFVVAVLALRSALCGAGPGLQPDRAEIMAHVNEISSALNIARSKLREKQSEAFGTSPSFVNHSFKESPTSIKSFKKRPPGASGLSS
eukprot:3988659-Pyramimonas_sp.AAC.2